MAATSPILFSDATYASLDPVALQQWIADASAAVSGSLPAVALLEPTDGVVIPPDYASPLFRWEAEGTGTWLITLEANGAPLASGLLGAPVWEPKQKVWEAIRSGAGANEVTVTVTALSGFTSREPVRSTTMTFRFSDDPVGVPLTFIRKPLPFRKAKDNPNTGELLVGDLSSYGPPRMVMTDQPICFNCHALSGDGKTYGLDMDFKGDKGAYALIDVQNDVALTDKSFVTWNELPAPTPAEYSMGLFTRISPDGKYLTSTVGESSLFIMMDDLWYSQLFYPATGRIGIMARDTGKVLTLPGADLETYSQTCPEFSPDGKTLVFSRTHVDPKYIRLIEEGVIRSEKPDQDIETLNKRYPVQFDICRIDFNNGKGGEARPLLGASYNGYSNYFPRQSPDGKWIVFTRSRTGLVLQPDSELCIVPAQGGPMHVLKANTPRMNSWHCWSPNGHWLAFASKANSAYTEIWLTHMDKNGNSSPGLRLHRFSSPDRACMTPEFLQDNVHILRQLGLADPDKAVGTVASKDGR